MWKQRGTWLAENLWRVEKLYCVHETITENWNFTKCKLNPEDHIKIGFQPKYMKTTWLEPTDFFFTMKSYELLKQPKTRRIQWTRQLLQTIHRCNKKFHEQTCYPEPQGFLKFRNLSLLNVVAKYISNTSMKRAVVISPNCKSRSFLVRRLEI